MLKIIIFAEIYLFLAFLAQLSDMLVLFKRWDFQENSYDRVSDKGWKLGARRHKIIYNFFSIGDPPKLDHETWLYAGPIGITL